MTSREQSDGEDSVGETRTNLFVDATAETEMELRLSLEVDVEPDRIREDVPIYPESIPIRKRSADLGPQTGPNRSGPDTDCRYLAPRNPVGSYRGLEHDQ